jgi:hypothetical protein
MATHRFWRKMQAQRRRHAARQSPETTGLPKATGLSGTARRVNRVVAVVALFGAFGTVALAVALTPGAQTPASATAPQEDFKISRIEVPPAPAPVPVAAASLNTTVVMVQPPPEPAPKADRLLRTPRAPDERDAPSPATNEEARSGVRDVALADRPEPTAAREAVESADRKLDEDAGRSLEFGLSEPPPPGDVRDAAADDAALAEIEDAIEATVDETAEEAVEDAAIEEPAEEPVEEEVVVVEEPTAPEPAAPEPAVAAARTAPVTTDVNMRSRPSNGAAVIQVVPRKSTVEVIDCDYWCEVVYQGRRGFIYKGFVRGS